nr:hypothetical protein [Tanacetum cinerariifolium]GFA73518.1 hypothetical protein [Tanacetum cinerariifolium]
MILAMKTKNRPVKRKSPYDSDLECNTMGVSKKQHSEILDMFPHVPIIDDRTCGSKLPLNIHCLRVSSSAIEIDPTQKGNPLGEHIYGSTYIASKSISIRLSLNISADCINTPAPTHSDVTNASITNLPCTTWVSLDMTSLGANVDSSIDNGRGPYVFRISGKIYHWIGSMCPNEGNPPSGEHERGLKREIIEGLIEFLDNHNALVQLFCTAQNKYMEANIPEIKGQIIQCHQHTPIRTANTRNH